MEQREKERQTRIVLEVELEVKEILVWCFVSFFFQGTSLSGLNYEGRELNINSSGVWVLHQMEVRITKYLPQQKTVYIHTHEGILNLIPDFIESIVE